MKVLTYFYFASLLISYVAVKGEKVLLLKTAEEINLRLKNTLLISELLKYVWHSGTATPTIKAMHRLTSFQFGRLRHGVCAPANKHRAEVYQTETTLDDENKFSVIIRRTLVATAKSCMNHVNATESDLEHLREEPPYPEKAACILKCLLEKVGVVENDRYSKIGFLTIVTPLVFNSKKKMEHMRSVAENCDKEVNHKTETPCQIGNEITTCVFKYAPELHFKA